jgi:hypothetical protein
MVPLREIKENSADKSSDEIVDLATSKEEGYLNRIEKLSAANSLSNDDKNRMRRLAAFFKSSASDIREADSDSNAFAIIEANFNNEVASLKIGSERAKLRLHNLFEFVKKAFSEGNELLLLVTELTANTESARFIAQFGSEDYKEASKTMMLTERQDAILEEILDLDL